MQQKISRLLRKDTSFRLYIYKLSFFTCRPINSPFICISWFKFYCIWKKNTFETFVGFFIVLYSCVWCLRPYQLWRTQNCPTAFTLPIHNVGLRAYCHIISRHFMTSCPQEMMQNEIQVCNIHCVFVYNILIFFHFSVPFGREKRNRISPLV